MFCCGSREKRIALSQVSWKLRGSVFWEFCCKTFILWGNNLRRGGSREACPFDERVFLESVSVWLWPWTLSAAAENRLSTTRSKEMNRRTQIQRQKLAQNCCDSFPVAILSKQQRGCSSTFGEKKEYSSKSLTSQFFLVLQARKVLHLGIIVKKTLTDHVIILKLKDAGGFCDFRKFLSNQTTRGGCKFLFV